MELKELDKTASTDKEFDGHESRSLFTEYEDGQKLSGGFVNIWSYAKKAENRENIEIQLESFKSNLKGSLENVAIKKRHVSEPLHETLS